MPRSLRRALVWWKNAPGDGESIPRGHYNALTKAEAIVHCDYHECSELTCKGNMLMDELELERLDKEEAADVA